MILFDGDSFCYGSELQDISKRYSDLIGNALGTEIVNLGEIGSSNQRILSRSYEYILSNKVDLCVIGLTYLQRFSLPFNNTIQNWNGRPEKNSKDNKYLLAKYIYSSNSDFSIWYRFNYPFIKMFKDACKSRNIPVIFHANDPNISQWFKGSDISILALSFEEVNAQNNLSLGPYGHPLEEAHKKYAEYLTQYIKNYE